MGEGIADWDILRNEFPRLYKHYVAFECGPGWYDLLAELSRKIEGLLEEYAQVYKQFGCEDADDVGMYAVQVKEKYGTLRFYMSSETDEISDLIGKAEVLSTQVCESCGDPGKMRGSCWMEVRCERCFKERK